MAKKLCIKCKEIKPVEEFSVATNRSMGRTSSCKECTKAYRAEKKKLPPLVQLEFPI